MRGVVSVVMMEDVYLGLKIPDNVILTMVNKLLMVMGYLDTGLRPATIPIITQVAVVDCWVYILFLFLFTIFLMITKEVIVVVMMEVVYLVLDRPVTLPLKIMGEC